MIPQKIHYCWFGPNKMPQLVQKCIESWKHFHPNFEYKLWNEENFDISQYEYTKEAYAAKKYAFVTDIVRLYALKKEGGIYLDTDVELVKPLDSFLHLAAFTGYEGKDKIVTGIIASEKNGFWVTEQLDYYQDKHFILENNELDLTTNVQIITNNMKSKGFEINNTYQVYKDHLHIFPSEYFSPKDRFGKVNLTQNTVCIHHFASSWQTPKLRLKKFIFHSVLGPKITKFFVSLKQLIIRKKP